MTALDKRREQYVADFGHFSVEDRDIDIPIAIVPTIEEKLNGRVMLPHCFAETEGGFEQLNCTPIETMDINFKQIAKHVIVGRERIQKRFPLATKQEVDSFLAITIMHYPIPLMTHLFRTGHKRIRVCFESVPHLLHVLQYVSLGTASLFPPDEAYINICRCMSYVSEFEGSGFEGDTDCIVIETNLRSSVKLTDCLSAYTKWAPDEYSEFIAEKNGMKGFSFVASSGAGKFRTMSFLVGAESCKKCHGVKFDQKTVVYDMKSAFWKDNIKTLMNKGANLCNCKC